MGKYERNFREHENIKEHINSFHPFVSHYRLKHAPNRHYLESELWVNDLYKDFTN